MLMQQAKIIVSGRVQGVFYRASCQEVAESYGLKGYAKNLYTGEVEVIVQGKKDKIEKLIEWCKKGPAGASIKDVKVEWQEVLKELTSFEVR